MDGMSDEPREQPIKNVGGHPITLVCHNGDRAVVNTGEAAVVAVGPDGKFTHVVEWPVPHP
jgi:hypothetical protein